MKYLFLDTVTLLHYKLFEDIPWGKLIGFDDDFTIVICETVLAEIDKHKDHQKGRIRNRAKKLSGIFGEIFLKGYSRKVPVEYCRFSPPTKEDKENFDITVCDNRIILSALHSKYKLKDIIIVSSDNNLLIKSKEKALDFFQMGEEHLIKEELTEEEKKIKELTKKLECYENRLPDPFISFDNEETEMTINVQPPPRIDEELSTYIEKLKEKFPIKVIQKIDTNNYLSILSSLDDTPDVINSYNEMCTNFYKDSKELRQTEMLKSWLDKVFIGLNLFFTNKGFAPTENTNVFIDIPEDVVLYTEKDSISSVSCRVPVEPSRNTVDIFLQKQSIPKYKYFDMWNHYCPVKVD